MVVARPEMVVAEDSLPSTTSARGRKLTAKTPREANSRKMGKVVSTAPYKRGVPWNAFVATSKIAKSYVLPVVSAWDGVSASIPPDRWR